MSEKAEIVKAEPIIPEDDLPKLEFIVTPGQKITADDVQVAVKHLKNLIGNVRKDIVEIGRIMFLFVEQGLYKKVGYDSLREFLSQPGIDMREADAKKFALIYKRFCVELALPEDQISGVDSGKLKELLPYVNTDNAGQLLQQAKCLTLRDLKEVLQTTPTAQEIATADEIKPTVSFMTVTASKAEIKDGKSRYTLVVTTGDKEVASGSVLGSRSHTFVADSLGTTADGNIQIGLKEVTLKKKAKLETPDDAKSEEASPL